MQQNDRTLAGGQARPGWELQVGPANPGTLQHNRVSDCIHVVAQALNMIVLHQHIRALVVVDNAAQAGVRGPAGPERRQEPS